MGFWILRLVVAIVAFGPFHATWALKKAPTPLVSVRTDSVVSQGQIRLGQIAEIDASPNLKSRLERIPLGRAPLPGYEKHLEGSWISTLIRTRCSAAAGVAIHVPKLVTIRGAVQKLSSKTLKNLMAHYIRKRLGNDWFRLSQFRVFGELGIPPGPMHFEILSPEPKTLKAQVYLRVAVLIHGKTVCRPLLEAWMDRFENVICAAHSIPEGHVLSPGDIVIRRINISRLSEGLITNVQSVLGKQARQPIEKGAPLWDRLLESRCLVLRGQRVKIVAQLGDIHFSTIGIARAQGAAGAQVQVVNADTKKLLVGTVTGPGIVTVVF